MAAHIGLDINPCSVFQFNIKKYTNTEFYKKWFSYRMNDEGWNIAKIQMKDIKRKLAISMPKFSHSPLENISVAIK